jgi:hypothetical protein
MKTLQRIIFFVAVLGFLAICFFQYRAGIRLREENASLRANLDQLKQLDAEGAPAPAENPLTKDQLAELLRLRGEVTQLRGQTNQIATLAEANKKLVAGLKEMETSRTNSPAKKSLPDALPQDIHPRATWAYRGYGSPEATMESVLTAMLNGDKAACIEGFSPDMRTNIEEQFESAALKAKADEAAEFRILDRKTVSEDEMVLSLYITSKNADGTVEGHSEKTVFDRIGGEWKVTEKQAPPDNP